MPEPIVQRLKEFMTYKGINASQLAARLGYKSSEKLHRLFREEGAKPGPDVIMDIANHYPDLNKEWWLTGKGNMQEAAKEKSYPHTSTVSEPPDPELKSMLEDDIVALAAIDTDHISDAERIQLYQRLIKRYQYEIRLLQEEIQLREDLLRLYTANRKTV
jgi:transcriptional regulator with XRE-family HTH domain